MKHDTLQHKTAFYAAACTIADNKQTILLGYIYVDMIKHSELEVIAGTGEKYRIKIPDTMMHVSASHQFNYTVEIVKP